MSEITSVVINQVAIEEEEALLPELIRLLQDTVESGASVGFLPPLSAEEAQQYWHTVFQAVAQRECFLLVARENGKVVGSVQLGLATRANALHRAEVQKLFVLQSQRRRGTGKRLMEAIEAIARENGRTLLFLDTRQGDVSELLYQKIGYQKAGVIPFYAQSASGQLDGTVFYYKLLA